MLIRTMYFLVGSIQSLSLDPIRISQTDLFRQSERQELEELRQKCADLESKICHGVFQWKITDFAMRRQQAQDGTATVIHSRGFYSSPYGYKLCIRVNMNGVETGLGSHLSLFVHFMKGDNDNTLDWPFQGAITLSILDQSDGMKRHISETIVARDHRKAFEKPTSERNLKGYGYVQFALLHDLNHPRSMYVRDDTLVIRAVVKESYNLMQ